MSTSTESLIERRLEPRRVLGPNERLYVKIPFPFPKETEIEKEVIDISDNGLSFKMHVNDGYFPPGTPLSDVRILSPEYTNRSTYAEVRHVTKLKNKHDTCFYKIGLQFHKPSQNNDKISLPSLKLRPKRYSSDALFTKNKIVFFLNKEGEEILGEIINFSKFGIAFKIDDINQFVKKSEVIKNFKVVIDGEVLYDGEICIAHLKQEKDKIIVGAFFRNDLIDLNKISNLNTKARIEKNIHNYLSSVKSFEKIEEKFKAIVTDTRGFLENIKRDLDKEEETLKRESVEKYLELEKLILPSTLNLIKDRLDNAFIALNAYTSNPDDERHLIYKEYFQVHLHHLLLLSPLMNRSYSKPLGYAGDYEMMNLIYRNTYEGHSLFGKLMNKYLCLAAPSRANRSRVPYLIKHINKIAETVSKNNEKVLFSSIGSGSAIEIQEFMQSNELCNKCKITLLDHEPEALMHCQDRLFELKTRHTRRTEIDFLNMSIVQFIKTYMNDFTYPRQNLIYSVGLFEYLLDKTCKSLIKYLFNSLTDDGILVLGNFDPINSFRAFMDYGVEWYMFYRTKDDMLKLTEGIKGAKRIYCETDETKIINFLIIEK